MAQGVLLRFPQVFDNRPSSRDALVPPVKAEPLQRFGFELACQRFARRVGVEGPGWPARAGGVQRRAEIFPPGLLVETAALRVQNLSWAYADKFVHDMIGWDAHRAERATGKLDPRQA